MSLLKYFQREEGIPDSKTPLSLSILSCIIALANCEVQEEFSEKEQNPKKRDRCYLK